MFNGHNIIGLTTSAAGTKTIKAFSTVEKDFLPGSFTVAVAEEIELALAKATEALGLYKNTSAEQRAVFLETIAAEIIAIGDELIKRAHLESGLPVARITGERDRTTNQLKLFAAVLREGSWVEAVIDTALPERKPLPRVDLRKMNVPVGPVVVFGASNFPLAFSTAGGDTASALAAGNPVIIKSHEAHPGTNELVANAILKAVEKCGMPDGVFSSLNGEGVELGQTLAKHPLVKAIAFTGSHKGGMALYKTAINEREIPIPVFAEMSSVNPVLLLPGQLAAHPEKVAAMVAGSISLGVGQFCTNPGLLFLIEDEESDQFIYMLTTALQSVQAGCMLNENVANNYYKSRAKMMQLNTVTTLTAGADELTDYKGTTALLTISAVDFMADTSLQTEVFGPLSVIVKCSDTHELLAAVKTLHGQLTGTVMGTDDDLTYFTETIFALQEKVGRLIFNGMPTGVEVSYAMVHGGPYPATTDARSTSVGADAIKRFVRPVCYQDCPTFLLPEALQNNNPLQIMRKINGAFTKAAIE